MARALAKVKAHNGGGSGNAAYIGRPQEERSREAEPRPGEEPAARGERLAEMREGDAGPARGRASGESDDDPVWGWNIPWFVAGEAHGVWETEEGRALLESRSLALSARHLGLGPAPPSAGKLSVEEKRENLVAHFSAMADLEERRGGLSHFRIILSVGPEVSISELKAMANAFLRANFLLCPAFVAIHDDTEHRHAHLYVHARQLDNRRVDLGQDYFRLDESWMGICAEHLDRPEIYDRHIELKEETRGWSVRAEKARDERKPLPPKPDRWGDHHDTLLIFRPFDNRWCGRLQAQTRVAETKVTWLEATRASAEDVSAARITAEALRERLDSAAGKRSNSKRETKRMMPAEIITVREARELTGYERDLREVEKVKEPNRLETDAPEKRATQVGLNFDEPIAAREGQTGFDFKTPAGSKHSSTIAAEDTKHNEPERENKTTGGFIVSPPAPPTSLTNVAVPQTLPDKEAGQLVVNLDLARARTIFLRSEERNLAVMPHRWVSPVSGTSLRGLELEIKERSEQKKDFTDLGTLREQLQKELAVERRSLPHRRAEAEAEVQALSARLADDMSARKAAGMTLPVAQFSEKHLNELMGYAEPSRDRQLLERIYNIESGQAMDDAQASGDPRIIRRLEEKYTGLKLKAEINLHRDEKLLAWERKHESKLLLPTRDKEGRDIAHSLAEHEPRKGLRGALGKLIESQGQRELRERLEAAKESYLQHREGEVETGSAYGRTLGSLTKNCHELSREFGWQAPAAPALSIKEIAEIRAYAVRQPEGIAKPWLKQCVEAQSLFDNRDAKSYRAREGADETTPRPEERERREQIQKELEERRRTLERMVPVPSRVVVPRESPSSIAREKNDPDKPNRGGRRGGR
jgi:hypothetical protein